MGKMNIQWVGLLTWMINTIKRCKEVITIKGSVALTFGETEENVIGTGHVKALWG